MLVGLSMLFASVDINNANKQELTSLNGISDKKAEAIIEYRKSKCFEKVDDLANVKGIGEKIVKKNKEQVIIGKCNISH
jgi:competence protein ComEA